MDNSSRFGLLRQESYRTSLGDEGTSSGQSVVDEKYVQILIDKEINSGFNRDESLVLSQEIELARLESLAWILKTRALYGFCIETAYLSVAYLDRFLSRKPIDSDKLWVVKLLSVACLSLAAKLEEVNVPALTEFQIDGYDFGCSAKHRMELLVLNTLNWRMREVTPSTFLHYFIKKFYSDSPPKNILSTTGALILSAIREINMADHRPSTVAAAATLVVLDQTLTRETLECKINSISCEFLEIEDVFVCYTVMRKLEIETPVSSSPDLSPPQSRRASVFSSKRRRLSFDDGGDDIGESSNKPNEK